VVVLGVDPGTATTGYGVVLRRGGDLTALAWGVVRTSPKEPTPERLRCIYDAVSALIREHSVTALATERLFFARNEATAFGVGRTIGAVLLSAAERSLPWAEYTPLQVKQAVVGYGAADKRQVQYMVQRILALDAVPTPDDAADALAVAICHANTTGRTR
jgi:crossover junction endodeoxyribonuclease RuvC